MKAVNYASYYYKTERGVKREGERLTNFWLWKGHPLQPHHICTVSELASCLEGAHSLGFLLPSITHLTILTSGNNVSSVGQLVCLHMRHSGAVEDSCRLWEAGGTKAMPGPQQGHHQRLLLLNCSDKKTLLFSRRNLWSQEAIWYLSLSSPGLKVDVLTQSPVKLFSELGPFHSHVSLP